MNGFSKSRLIGSAILFIFITYFSINLIFRDFYRIILLDDLNLLIHEAGHLVFNPFGYLIGLFGGTIMQILIPAVFLIYFCKNKDYLGTAFSVFWIGENFINISTYIKDAKFQELSLVGGGIHDWNAILTSLNLLESYKLIGDMIFILGLIFLIAAFCLNLFHLLFSVINKE